MTKIKAMFMDGLATKEQYAGTLRGYQNALEKCPREEAKTFLQKFPFSLASEVLASGKE